MRPMQKPSTESRAPSLLQQQRTDVNALRLKREELKNQLQGLTERRVLLSVQLQQAQGGDAGRALERQIAELDARTARIEADLNRTDDAITRSLDRDIANQGDLPITAAPPALPAPTIAGPEGVWSIQPAFPRNESAIAREMMRPLILFGSLQLALLAVIAWRWIRAKPAAGTVRLSPEDSGRIDQLQRAVDVIAVEVERISESQRFVNKALGGGALELIKVQHEKESAR